MQRLHHGYTRGSRGRVSGRRDQRKGVVEVHDAGSQLSHQSTELAVHRAVPERGDRQWTALHVGYAVVMHGIGGNLMAVRAQEGGLRGKHGVFPTCLLVVLVNQQETFSRHRGQPQLCDRQRTPG